MMTKQSRFTLLALLSILSCLSMNAQLTASQLFHYPFDGNANDVGVNGLNGTLQNSPTFVNGHNGTPNGAIQLNGSNQYVQLPNVAMMRPTGQPISFSFWVNPTSLNSDWKPIFSMDQAPSIWAGYWCAMTDSWLAIYFGDGGIAGPGSRRQAAVNISLPLNSWTHVVGIIRGPTDMDIYINCVQQNINYAGSGGSLSWAGFGGAVGRSQNGSFIPGFKYFNGALDELRFWERELTAAEIQQFCIACVDDTVTLSENICQGDSLLFDGQWLSQAGQYQTTTTLPSGCDSITLLELNVGLPDTVEMDLDLCRGDSVFFNGRWRDQTGIYRDITALPNGCDSVSVMNLVMRDTFNIEVYDTLCANESIVFGGQTISSGGTYTDMQQSVFGCDSMTTLYLAATNYSDSISIRVEGNSCRSGFLVLRAIGARDYLWNTGATTDTIQVLFNGTFRVTGRSSCGVSTAEITLDDDCLKSIGEPPSRVFVPSAFTPNGDGINEVFLPQGNGVLTYQMDIYNRWGEPIFSTKNINEGWNGTFNGELMPPGAYSYIISYTVSGELFKRQTGIVFLRR